MSILAEYGKDENGYFKTDEKGKVHVGEEPVDALCDWLGWCGCGIPDEALRYVGRILAFCGRDRDADPSDWDSYCAMRNKVFETESDVAQYALLYFLDTKKLLEHGGGIASSWLTPLGEELLSDILNLPVHG